MQVVPPFGWLALSAWYGKAARRTPPTLAAAETSGTLSRPGQTRFTCSGHTHQQHRLGRQIRRIRVRWVLHRHAGAGAVNPQPHNIVVLVICGGTERGAETGCGGVCEEAVRGRRLPPGIQRHNVAVCAQWLVKSTRGRPREQTRCRRGSCTPACECDVP